MAIMDQLQPDSSDTKHLLAELRAGDAQAFDRLFQRHHRYLKQVIELRLDPRLSARLDSSDVLQETALDAFRRVDDFLKRRPMPFRLWLRKTACERLQTLWRRHVQASRRSVDREIPLPDQSSFSLVGGFASHPSRTLTRRELTQNVRHALAEMPATDRELLLMRNLEGLSNQDVALLLEIAPAAASQRYGRALLRLQKLLIKYGVTEGPDHG